METNLFAQRVKYLRQLKKLSLEDLAKSVGVSKTALSRYEHGTRSPKLEILHALAEYFAVDMTWLSGFSSTEKKNVGYPFNENYGIAAFDETLRDYDISSINFELQKIYADLSDEKQKILLHFAEELQKEANL